MNEEAKVEETQKGAETQTSAQSSLEQCAAQLSSAAEALERVIGKLEAQYESLNQKIDRIIATVEKAGAEEKPVVEEKKPEEPKKKSLAAEGERGGERRTLAPLVGRLLAKGGEVVGMDCATLEKALQGLTIEQRMAVKSELARAGWLG
jgi:septal ring factor EnvC (AmiA/AmiB activator)